jgi:hypothetical protein
LAYCVNGGLLNQFLDINCIVEQLNKNNQESVFKLIDYLLYIKNDKDAFNFEEDLILKIRNLVNTPKEYYYNENIMISLVE